MLGVSAREAWCKAMDIQTGKYFDDGVKEAVKTYEQKYGSKLKVSIDGYALWEAKNKSKV